MSEQSRPEWTQHEALLLGAADLESRGKYPCSTEDLIVAAWQRSPARFGLPGYNYPHSQRVIVCLSGSHGVVGRGFLDRVKVGRYRLTDRGRAIVRRLEAGPAVRGGDALTTAAPAANGTPTRTIELDSEDCAFLRHLLNSHAVRKENEGSRRQLISNDAIAFWQLIDDDRELTAQRLDDIGQRLRAIEDVLDGGKRALMDDGREVSAGEVRALRFLHEHLDERWGRYLRRFGVVNTVHKLRRV